MRGMSCGASFWQAKALCSHTASSTPTLLMLAWSSTAPAPMLSTIPCLGPKSQTRTSTAVQGSLARRSFRPSQLLHAPGVTASVGDGTGQKWPVVLEQLYAEGPRIGRRGGEGDKSYSLLFLCGAPAPSPTAARQCSSANEGHSDLLCRDRERCASERSAPPHVQQEHGYDYQGDQGLAAAGEPGAFYDCERGAPHPAASAQETRRRAHAPHSQPLCRGMANFLYLAL